MSFPQLTATTDRDSRGHHDSCIMWSARLSTDSIHVRGSLSTERISYSVRQNMSSYVIQESYDTARYATSTASRRALGRAI